MELKFKDRNKILRLFYNYLNLGYVITEVGKSLFSMLQLLTIYADLVSIIVLKYTELVEDEPLLLVSFYIFPFRYLINFLLDATLGMLLIYIGIRAVSSIVEWQQWDTLRFGEYGKCFCSCTGVTFWNTISECFS